MIKSRRRFYPPEGYLSRRYDGSSASRGEDAALRPRRGGGCDAENWCLFDGLIKSRSVITSILNFTFSRILDIMGTVLAGVTAVPPGSVAAYAVG